MAVRNLAHALGGEAEHEVIKHDNGGRDAAQPLKRDEFMRRRTRHGGGYVGLAGDGFNL